MQLNEPPRLELAALPTPLVRLCRLERQLGGTLFLKRDDLTGLEFSGNKIRKLEYVLAAAEAEGQDTIVTEGAPQSNHCRATAAACARLGLGAVLLLRPPPPEPPQGNYFLDRLFGAQVRCFDAADYAARRPQIVAEVLSELRGSGRVPRFTPAGASEPLGCWGYIKAARELHEQLAATGVGECDIVVALSSGGTCAGLLLGSLLYRLEDWRIWAVPVSEDRAWHERHLTELCQATIGCYGLPVEFSAKRLHIVGGYVGPGYAIPYDRELEAIRLLARTEGIVLDPVYTGKAFCAFLDGLREGWLGGARPVVFLHTGGLFSDFAWPSVLLGGPG
jgi:D-cysteine desulfhydrase